MGCLAGDSECWAGLYGVDWAGLCGVGLGCVVLGWAVWCWIIISSGRNSQSWSWLFGSLVGQVPSGVEWSRMDWN